MGLKIFLALSLILISNGFNLKKTTNLIIKRNSLIQNRDLILSIHSKVPVLQEKESRGSSLFAGRLNGDNNEKQRVSIFHRLSKWTKGLWLSVVLACTIGLSNPISASARSRAATSTKQRPSQKRTTDSRDDSKRKRTAKVEVVIDDMEDKKLSQEDNKRVKQIGYFLLGATLVAFFFPDGDAKTKTKGRKSAKSSAPAIKPQRRKPGTRASSPLSPPKDLLEEEEDLDDLLFDSDADMSALAKGASRAAKAASSTGGRPRQKKIPKFSFEEEEEEKEDVLETPVSRKRREPVLESEQLEEEDPFLEDLPPYASIIPAPEESKLPAAPVPKEEVKPEPEETTEKKAPGLLGRLFQKPGGGRPTDLETAVKTGDHTQDFRVAVASALSSYAPGLVPNYEKGGLFASGEDVFSSDVDQTAAALKECLSLAGMSEQEAGTAFAEVTNPLLVKLVDAAVSAQDKAKKGEQEDPVLPFLDRMTGFMRSVGELFGRVSPTAAIEPIQYNGRAKKGKLENLYARYLKSTMDLSKLAPMLKMVANPEEASEELPQEDLIREQEDQLDRVSKTQFLFNIKESKRSAIENKLTREMVMSMTKDLASGGGDLSGIMEALGGKGGDPAQMAGMEELLGQLGGEGGAGLPPDMPDLSNMNPEEMAAMSKDLMAELKVSLAQGSITKDDVKELEKMMGMDVKQLVKMMDSGQVDKRKLKEMGPDFTDMMDVFRQLSNIK